MNWMLWLLQIGLGTQFIKFGLRKLVQPIESVNQRIDWTKERSSAFVKFVGWIELAGGLGLILPTATRIRPILTPIAAIGIALLMILGGRLHLSRGELKEFLRHEPWIFLAASVIAWGRSGHFRIDSRGQ